MHGLCRPALARSPYQIAAPIHAARQTSVFHRTAPRIDAPQAAAAVLRAHGRRQPRIEFPYSPCPAGLVQPGVRPACRQWTLNRDRCGPVNLSLDDGSASCLLKESSSSSRPRTFCRRRAMTLSVFNQIRPMHMPPSTSLSPFGISLSGFIQTSLRRYQHFSRST